MKKSLKLIFSLLLIISIIGGSPIIFERYKVETSNKEYELVVDNKSIQNITNKEKRDEFYKELKKVNADTITFNNLSIDDLSKYRDIKYMTVKEYLEENEQLKYNSEKDISKYALKDNIIIMLSKKDFSTNEINTIKKFLGNYENIETEEDIFLYVHEPLEVQNGNAKSKNYLITGKFFIDETAIKEVVDAGLKPMLSIDNSSSDEVQDIIFEQTITLSNEFNIDKIQLRGTSVIGHPNNTDRYLEEFKKNNISVVTTEFQTKVGLNPYLESGKENLIRGHEIPVNILNLSSDEFSARIARAIKERNMRTIIITEYIDYANAGTMQQSVDNILKDLESAQELLDNVYVEGDAVSYPAMDKKQIPEIFIALASASLIGLLVISLINNDKYSALSIVCAVVVFVGAFVINKFQIGIGIKAYALGVAILGACAAIIVPYKSDFKSVFLKFILTSLLATLTGLLVASIMYGSEYLLKLKAFSGVKLLYIAPPVLVAIWVIIESGILSKINSKNIKNIKLDKEAITTPIKNIRWYHIALVVIVLVGGFVYITRSGNSGTVSDVELEFRRMLEKLLYVRPRTKEFMIGYPAVLLALYMQKNNIKYDKYMLIVASIATMSTANTFTHLHTPLVYSLLRTLYGVVLGLVVGLIYIFIFEQIKKIIIKES